MKKILFPIAVATGLSIAALGTLQGLAQEDVAQRAVEVEKNEPEKKEPKKKEPVAGSAQSFPAHGEVELFTDEQVKEFSEKWFPTPNADRVIKLVARAKDLHKFIDDKVKKLDETAANPGLDDQQARNLGIEVTSLKNAKRNLNRAFHKFFFQPEPIGDPNTSMASRIARIAELNASIEGFEVQLGLRPAPTPRTGSSSPFSRVPRGGGGTFGAPPTRVDLLKAMSDEEVKEYLQARFPAAAMDRIGKVVTRARELVKTLDEKIAKIDADLVDEKLSDEQIEAMVMLARGYRSTKENLTREFDSIAMSNLSMQTMSEAVSWLPQLSRAVKQAESNIEGIDNQSLAAKAGIKASDFAEMYRQAKSLHSRYDDSLPAVQASLQNQNLSPQQRGAIEVELKALQASIQKLAQAIAEYDAMQAATEPISSERFTKAAKSMRDALAASRTSQSAAGGELATHADPKEAHRKLADRATSLRTDIANLLKSLTARLAEPNIAAAELTRLTERVAELQRADKELTEPLMGYLNSIENKPNADQAMVVNNVVLLQHAIRDAEELLGRKTTISVPSDTPYADVASAIEGSEASHVVVEEAVEISPLGKRLIAACESLKTQLEVRLKEVDEKLDAPDVTLEQITGLATYRDDLETAIEYCVSTQGSIRNTKNETSSSYAKIASRLRNYADTLVRPKLGPNGPVIQPTGTGMPMGSPTGSMGGPGMPGGSMPGMMPGMSGSMPGMMPGMAPPSPYQVVEELSGLYKKHFDEKNEQGASEIKAKIAKELARIFDAQQAAREKQLAAAREKLKKLEQQQARRTATRDELIESRTKQIIQELEGTAWSDEVEVPW